MVSDSFGWFHVVVVGCGWFAVLVVTIKQVSSIFIKRMEHMNNVKINCSYNKFFLQKFFILYLRLKTTVIM